VLTSKKVSAFDISRESEALRTKYGNTPLGNACLMARRLLEADVRIVEVWYGDWDTHVENFKGHEKLMKDLDPAWSALLEDLADRRMLEDTMVLWMGEFGRTPGVNASQGRDHFSKAWTVALSGGGIQGGRVVGSTDETGRDIKDRPVSVADLFATIYSVFGVGWSKEYMTAAERPIKILEGGTPVKELF
jgi:uncharacterized protein (DUF1501 family)